jgi:guanine deaminase
LLLHLLTFHAAVRLVDAQTKLGVGMLDFFDLVPGTNSPKLSLDMVEKWWSLGDVKNRAGVWVQGIKLT